MRSPPSMNCCIKLLAQVHVHRAHQTAWRTRQCPRGVSYRTAFLCECREVGGVTHLLCPQRRRIPSIICAVSPCSTLPCIAQCRERSWPPMPRQPRAPTTSTLTRPISPYPCEFPLPAGHAESVTVRRAMPADHHEALPSLLYLCGGLRTRRFMSCLHSLSVLCHSFFSFPPSLCLLYIFFFSTNLIYDHFNRYFIKSSLIKVRIE